MLKGTFCLGTSICCSGLQTPSLVAASCAFKLLPGFFLGSSFTFSVGMLCGSSFAELVMRPPGPPPVAHRPMAPRSGTESFEGSDSSRLASCGLLVP